MTAIIPTYEPPTETKRHPWVCNWKSGTHTCNRYNLASDTHCRACGKPYAPMFAGPYDPGDGIQERVSITDAVREYVELSKTVRDLFAQLDAIETRLGVLFIDQPHGDSIRKIDLNTYGHDNRVNYSRPDDVLSHAEREIWRAVVQRSGVSRISSNKRWEEMQRQLEKGEVPPLTPENVTAWVQQTVGDADEILREKVCEVFDFLRPRHDNFKTNSQFEIGKKVILEYMVETADARWGWKPRLRWERRQIIVSLETLFRNLDGYSQSLTTWESDLSIAISKCEPDNATGATEYFKFKAHRNGTLHLTFTRPELVAKLNAIAGGKTLRGNRKAAG